MKGVKQGSLTPFLVKVIFSRHITLRLLLPHSYKLATLWNVCRSTNRASIVSFFLERSVVARRSMEIDIWPFSVGIYLYTCT